MSKIKLFRLIACLVLLGSSLVLYILFETPILDHRLQSYSAWHFPSAERIEKQNSSLQNFIPGSGLNLKKHYDLNKTAELYLVEMGEKRRTTQIDFSYAEIYDANFIQDFYFVEKGVLGAEIEIFNEVKLSTFNENFSKEINTRVQIIEPKTEKLFIGLKDPVEVKSELTDNFAKILAELKADSHLTFEITEKERLENVALQSVNLLQPVNPEIISFDEEVGVNVGEVNVSLDNCNREFNLIPSYNYREGEYGFSNLEDFVEFLCIKQFIETNGYFVGTCTECTLYPANKSYALRSDYVPEVALIDFAPGSQSIAGVAYGDFKELYNAAKSSGVNLFVTSGYRSYASQQNTFEAWVQVEMASGYNRSQAEVIANSYSAKAGFSEHQLGTALDLNGASCVAFSLCSGNQQAWDWLAANAHKFGFVISYPQGKQNQTGYIYEPWHYRWIGKELAAEYKEVESSTFLQQWLFELNRY